MGKDCLSISICTRVIQSTPCSCARCSRVKACCVSSALFKRMTICSLCCKSSLTAPCLMRFPFWRIATRLHTCWTSCRKWLEMKMVLPNSASRWISWRISNWPAGSSPFVGSSKRTSSGSVISAAPMPRRCFIPIEYLRKASLALVCSSTISSTSSTRRLLAPPEIIPEAEATTCGLSLPEILG